MAHYYVTITDPQTQGFDTLLRSLIYQIGASTEITRKMAEKYYNNAGRGNREPYLDELYDLLKDLLTLQRSVFIIIDALDESKELDITLEFIETLVHWNITGVHLLLSSRELPSVQHILPTLRPSAELFFMEVGNAQVKLDIERYLRKELERSRRMWSEKDKQRIIHDLVKSSEGMYGSTFPRLSVITLTIYTASATFPFLSPISDAVEIRRNSTMSWTLFRKR